MASTYTPAEVAERLGRDRRTIYRHIKAGKLRAEQPAGHVYVITRSALIEYLGSDLFREVFEQQD